MHAAKENIVKKDNSIAAECVCSLKIPLTVWVSLWKRATVRQPPVSMHVSCNVHLLNKLHCWSVNEVPSTLPGELENTNQSLTILDLCRLNWKTRAGESNFYPNVFVYEMFRFQNVFYPH